MKRLVNRLSGACLYVLLALIVGMSSCEDDANDWTVNKNYDALFRPLTFDKSATDATSVTLRYSQIVNAKVYIFEFYTDSLEFNTENYVRTDTILKDTLTVFSVKELPEEEWIVVERPEMRIISDELFNRAQELLEQRSNEFKLNNKREKTEYVFSTLIYCKHCGYSFRRIKRKYTADGPEYIRWVCSGRNSMGVNHCPNTTVIDEEELLNAIKIYLKSIIKNKKDFMKAVEKEFEKITKLRENNERSEESLLKKIEKVTVKKQKYMEMFQNEIINIQELKKYTNPLNEDIARLERELKLITSEIKEKDVLEKELSKTINTVDDILNNQTITNAMLKTIIDVIEVDSDSNVEVRLKLLNEIGSTPAVITNFNDINPTVTKSNVST